MRRYYIYSLPALLFAICIVAVAPAVAHRWDDCDGWERDSDWGDKGRYCEIRHLTLPVTDSVAVDAGRNGGISVRGTQQDEIEIEARVQIWARSEDRAIELADQIEIRTEGNRISAHSPDDDDWAVSYRLRVPNQTDLDLVAHNGGISVEEVEGRLRAETHNGGLSLAALAGDIQAETTNGGVRVELTGDRWQGSGLSAETRNGGVKLSIPEGYSAKLETGTVNGKIDIDFPVTVQGRMGRSIETTLGEGGPPVRVTTRNGSVTISQD